MLRKIPGMISIEVGARLSPAALKKRDSIQMKESGKLIPDLEDDESKPVESAEDHKLAIGIKNLNTIKSQIIQISPSCIYYDLKKMMYVCMKRMIKNVKFVQ